MNRTRLPIIVAEGWDVTLFDTVVEAELYIEPIDVTGGIYRGYDAEGQALEIETDEERVRIRAAEGSPGHAGELEELLKGILEHVGEPISPRCDLPCLVAACGRFKVDTPDSFRATLFGLLDDFWRSSRGRGIRRGRR